MISIEKAGHDVVKLFCSQQELEEIKRIVSISDDSYDKVMAPVVNFAGLPLFGAEKNHLVLSPNFSIPSTNPQ